MGIILVRSDDITPAPAHRRPRRTTRTAMALATVTIAANSLVACGSDEGSGERSSSTVLVDGKPLVVVTSPMLRRDLATLVRQAAPDALTLSFREVPETKRITVVAVIGSTE